MGVLVQKRPKRRGGHLFSHLLGLVVLASTLWGCGSEGSPAPTEPPPDPIPGTVLFGERGYVEHLVGSLPIILSAPHGGTLSPDAIPNRTEGTTVRDTNTEELARVLAEVIHERTGEYPHLTISRLRRTKLDPNREIVEAAAGDPRAETAWTEYHGFIDESSEKVEEIWGSGLYLDLHGHGHTIQRLELGYRIDGDELGLSDEELQDTNLIRKSSIRAVAEGKPDGLVGLLRGPNALGSLLAARGFPSVPSDVDPSPGENPYFRGGYSTERHGSGVGGTVSGIQIEMNFTGVRDESANRRALAEALTDALERYFLVHFGYDWNSPPPQ